MDQRHESGANRVGQRRPCFYHSNKIGVHRNECAEIDAARSRILRRVSGFWGMVESLIAKFLRPNALMGRCSLVWILLAHRTFISLIRRCAAELIADSIGLAFALNPYKPKNSSIQSMVSRPFISKTTYCPLRNTTRSFQRFDASLSSVATSLAAPNRLRSQTSHR